MEGSLQEVEAAVKEQVAALIPSEEALTRMLKDLPISMADIKIGDGELTFGGVKK